LKEADQMLAIDRRREEIGLDTSVEKCKTPRAGGTDHSPIKPTPLSVRLIFTGTPGTTSTIKDGDVVEIEIENIGILRNPVVAGR